MSDDWSIQVSPKTHAGTLVNIRGNDAEDISLGLSIVGGLAGDIAAVEALLNGASTVQAVMSTPVVAPTPIHTQPGGNPVATGAPPAAGKPCPHGNFVFRSGVSKKTGKAYGGWFCPAPMGAHDQCPAEFDPSYGR